MRPLLACTLVAAALLVPANALPILDPPRDDWPTGSEAVARVADFAMLHPMRAGDTPFMDAARADLAARLAALGFEVERHAYIGGENVVGILRGTERPHDWMVLSAHYDTILPVANGLVGATVFGAWDNGAGVAAALEIARVAANRPWRTTLAIAFFDDEENGLLGSAAFVRDYDGRVWDGAPIRLVANVNFDSPGLNWPCVNEAGVVSPVTLMHFGTGPGGLRLVDMAVGAVHAEGVPDDAWEIHHAGFPLAVVLWGSSDNQNFGERRIPDLYIGSTTHLRVRGEPVGGVYPLHTPADTLATMLAWCGGDPRQLARSFEVAMGIAWRALLGVDGSTKPFPRP